MQKNTTCKLLLFFIQMLHADIGNLSIGNIPILFLTKHSISYYKFNGIDSVIREIEVRPWILEIDLDHKQNIQYYIVFTISIDKVFGKNNNYTINDFCTEFDIVNLKKAIFENGDNGPFDDEDLKGMRLSDWVTFIINEIEGSKRKKHK